MAVFTSDAMKCIMSIPQLRKAWMRVFILSAATIVIIFTSTSIHPFRFNQKNTSSVDALPKFTKTNVPLSLSKDVKYDTAILPAAKYSRMNVLNATNTFKLGDLIYVRIDLHNSLNQPITRGGDLILIWMDNSIHGASVTGSVKDHVNGSYTGILRASWAGRGRIKCAIACTREGYDLMYQYFKDNGPLRNNMCVFQTNQKKEYTLGSFSVPLDKVFCNFTAENYGIPWYCVKPKENGFHCSDWTKVSNGILNRNRLYENKTNDLYYVRAISHQNFTNAINIMVATKEATTMIPTTPCSGAMLMTSWSAQSPVGFFYNNTWYPANCNLNFTQDYHQCFQNRQILLYGDSTVRQWFTHLFDTLELMLITEKWNTTTWHRKAVARKEEYNYDVTWDKHGLPIFFGEINRRETRPIHAALDEIPAGSTHFVLINLYVHFHYHHPSAFRRNLEHISKSVRVLLQRSPQVKIAIKGPHYFSYRDRMTLGGMWGPVYSQITREVFEGLYDKVLFIDVWDMTVDRENRDVHPSSILIKSMVSVFLNYVCN